MPSNKKKKSGPSRPDFHPQTSMPRDIEAARKHNLESISSKESLERDQAEDGMDVADQLLATLDARDRAAVNVDIANRKESLLQVPETHRPHKSKSNQSASSGHSMGEKSSHEGSSPRRSPAELLLHAGEKIFKSHHSKSPPPPSISPDQDKMDENLATDMQRRGSIRERLFGSSPSKEDDSNVNGGARKVSRQQARKVSSILCR